MRKLAVSAVRLGAKAVKRGQLTLLVDFEDRATVVGPAKPGCPIEVGVGGLHQSSIWSGAISAVCLGAKAVKRDQLALRRDFEYCAACIGPTLGRCPIEVTIRGLDQRPSRADAVCAPALNAEAVQRGQGASGSDFEDRTTGPLDEDPAARGRGPSEVCRAVQVPVGGLDQPTVGVFAIRATALGAKAVKRCQRATRRDLEDCDTGGCPVKVAIAGLDEARDGTGAAQATGLGAESVKSRQRAARGDPKDGTAAGIGVGAVST